MRSYESLAKQVQCSVPTLKRYLCRAEFTHIEKLKKDKKVYLKNVTEEDITKLYNLTHARQRLMR